MVTRNGSVLVKAVAGILTLGAAGAGALHFTGTCPLGSCSSGDKTASSAGSVTMVASTGDTSSACERSCDGSEKAPIRATATEAAFFETGEEAPGSCEGMQAACDEAKMAECHESKGCTKEAETIVADNTTGK